MTRDVSDENGEPFGVDDGKNRANTAEQHLVKRHKRRSGCAGALFNCLLDVDGVGAEANLAKAPELKLFDRKRGTSRRDLRNLTIVQLDQSLSVVAGHVLVDRIIGVNSNAFNNLPTEVGDLKLVERRPVREAATLNHLFAGKTSHNNEYQTLSATRVQRCLEHT